ncbi:hypothetical protein HDE_09700 [Halotydeus destructor]|nr:hypothetical protein HDE_09700 [Halotydeus destructor]
MMTVKFLIVAFALVAISEAIVCPPNYCASVKCNEELTEESCSQSGGVFKKNGGFCGCCDHCPKKLAEYANCFGTLLRGAPASVVCPEGFHCNAKTVRCEPL